MTIQKCAALVRKIRFPKVCHVLAVSVVALGAVSSFAPAMAATVSYNVGFSIQGIYDSGNWYGDGTAVGSFDITYDPTLAGVGGYPNQSLTGVISGLSYTVSVPELAPVNLHPITSFTFNYGTLTLYSDYATDQSKNFTGVADLVIGINGLPVIPPSGESAAGDIWFSLATDSFTETGSGTATFTPFTPTSNGANTPLPAALPLFASGLGVVGLLARRRKRKNIALAA
jgi:hypothetical protein